MCSRLIVVCLLFRCLPAHRCPGSVASAAASSHGPLVPGCSSVFRCILLAAPSLPESGLAAYGASARSPSFLLTWLVPLGHASHCHYTARPRTAHLRSRPQVAPLQTTLLSASPPREALGCTRRRRLHRRRAKRLAVPPSRRDCLTHLLAPSWQGCGARTGAPRPRVASPHGGHNRNIVVVLPNVRRVLFANPPSRSDRFLP